MTNDDLLILDISDDDTFATGVTDVCIAVREGDSELQGILQGALDAIEWDRDKMDALMEEAITLQPSAN